MRNLVYEMFRRGMGAYNLDGWTPPQPEPAQRVMGQPQTCHLCGQLVPGWALDLPSGTILCLGEGGCYETSEYAHRKFRPF